METKSQKHHHQTAGSARSPRMLRSKSVNPNVFAPDIHTCTSNSGRKSVDRSKSTERPRIKNDDEDRNPSMTTVSNSANNPQENRECLVRAVYRSPRSSSGVKAVEMPKTKRRSSSVSPSAWALSPGRHSTSSPVIDSADSGRAKLKSTRGMSGVLKYFRQNKVSPIQEEAFHRLRVLHNRLLQWRFANARAETSMIRRKRLAQGKLFSVWLGIFQMRNSVVEKRIQMQRLKHEIKIYEIIGSQTCSLKEWARIEKRNSEAVQRMARKLPVTSIKVPLVRGAAADTRSIHEAMCMAMGVMESIGIAISKYSLQVEKVCSLTKEIKETVKQQRESLDELNKMVYFVASLQVQENSLRGYLIQISK